MHRTLLVSLVFALTSTARADDPVLLESQWIDPTPGGSFICWGWEVDAVGDVAVSCAPFLPALGIFERNGSTWDQVQGFSFTGIHVATDGTTVLSQRDLGALASRQIDVYAKPASDWELQQTLTVGANSGTEWLKGLDVHGDLIVVAGTDEVELWDRQGGVWARGASLAGADTQTGDLFAWSVSVHDGTIVVGAPEAAGGGAAYVFLKLGCFPQGYGGAALSAREHIYGEVCVTTKHAPPIRSL